MSAATDRFMASVFTWHADRGLDVRCGYCGRPVSRTVGQNDPSRATVDHKTPVARGGSPWRQANMLVACRVCNQAKGPLTAGEYRLVRGDWKALRALKATVQAQLAGTTVEALQAARDARRDRITARLQEPDPDCRLCQGRGVRRNHGRNGRPDPCACAVRGATPNDRRRGRLASTGNDDRQEVNDDGGTATTACYA